MATRDLHNNVHPVVAVAPAAATVDNTPWVTAILDTAGFESAELVLITGVEADADAVFTVLFEDGNDPALADHAPVDDIFLLGTEALAGFTFADDGKTRKIGYTGSKRYVRATVTPAANAAAAFLAAIWLQGHAHFAPTPNPPQP